MIRILTSWEWKQKYDRYYEQTIEDDEENIMTFEEFKEEHQNEMEDLRYGQNLDSYYFKE